MSGPPPELLLACLICGGPPEAPVVFVPAEPWRYCPAPPVAGKLRVCLLWLCWPCAARPNLAKAVGAALARGMGGGIVKRDDRTV